MLDGKEEKQERRKKRKKEDEQNRNFLVWVFSTLLNVSGVFRVDLAIE